MLTAFFLAASVASGEVSWELMLIVLAYTCAPVACAWWSGPDFVTIALLWLPLEFPAGAAHLIAKHAQGFLHSVAYGIAILLGVVVFACFRRISGMKINWPQEWGDLRRALMGFALTAAKTSQESPASRSDPSTPAVSPAARTPGSVTRSARR